MNCMTQTVCRSPFQGGEQFCLFTSPALETLKYCRNMDNQLVVGDSVCGCKQRSRNMQELRRVDESYFLTSSKQARELLT